MQIFSLILFVVEGLNKTCRYELFSAKIIAIPSADIDCLWSNRFYRFGGLDLGEGVDF